MTDKLKIISNTKESVVLENLCKTPLDVALNPSLSLDIAYISITKGNSHVFTAIRKDGTTWSFEWGDKGTTLISEGTLALEKLCLDFLKDNFIFVGLTSKPVSVRWWINGLYAEDGATLRIDADDGSYECVFTTRDEAMNLEKAVKEKFGI